ncbi:cytochrome P450 [Thelonectria olida]|uniref:Cytochrome P450 n=1 Tax=Thelonectria olida TaxID=1576542 RepID=A0A9P9AKS8_9HYPO|nr:cytochrome P450 [Thelonectria olida]
MVLRDSLAALASFCLGSHFILSLTTLLIPFTCTYAYTWARFRLSRHHTSSREPAVLPYWFPGVGHLFSLGFGPEKFLRALVKRLRGVPARIPLLGKEIYLAMPGAQIEKIWRSSRDLVPTPSLFDALHVFFGLQEMDFRVFDHEHISNFEECAGYRTNHPDTSRRVMEHQRKDFVRFLQGQNLRSVVERFTNSLMSELSPATGIGHDWVIVADLFDFMANRILRANVEALYGENILKVCPTFCEDFWAFYRAFPAVSRGLPKCDERLYDAEYEPIWGSQCVRRMVIRHEDLGFTDDGVATVLLGYFFVTVANTIPAAMWMMMHVLLDQELLRRVQEEISAAFLLDTSCPSLRELESAPLFNSVYCETLRLRVASAVGRTSLHDKFRLAGDWKIKIGVPIMFTGWLGGLDETFWNTGRRLPGGGPEHPVDSFWADRFLEYPDDPTSGPVRTRRRTNMDPQTTKNHGQAKVNLAGVQGHWFPFGGGASRCPGEALAKRVVLTSVAMVVRNMDVKFVNPAEAAKTTSKHRTLPFGSHTFDRPVPVWIRRQQCVY